SDQVLGEVGHAVQRDRRGARLHHHAASRAPYDLVASAQRQLDRAHRGLVAADSGLRYGAGSDRGSGGSDGPRTGDANRLAVAVAALLAALLAHGDTKSRS